jgi:hypothetical protein
MYKIVSAIVILILLAGNIYFYITSKKSLAEPGVKTEKFKTNSALPPAADNYKYPAPAYNMYEEMTKVENSRNELKVYASKNKCNTKYAFVVDMRIPSFKKRFFVIDLTKDSITNSGYVAHGTGSETFRNELVFSNLENSRCTSLGKYKIGAAYNGIYGLSYRLYGLDSTNNNAFKRAIVLHGHDCVPEKAYDEYPICFSYGCPMVSTRFFKILRTYMPKPGGTPLLLSIIY